MKAIKAWPIVLIAAVASLPITAAADPYEGLYFGGHVGHRWVNGNFSSPAYTTTVGANPITFPARSEGYSPQSSVIGVHAGYNMKLSPLALAGFEADWDYGPGRQSKGSSSSYSVTIPVDEGASLTTILPISQFSRLEADWQATIRGRLGFIVGSSMIYATGGAAFMSVSWRDEIEAATLAGTTVTTSKKSETLTGFTVGAGIENAVNEQTLLRLEYLYERFGNINVPHGFGPQLGKLDLDAHKLRLGVSFAINTF